MDSAETSAERAHAILERDGGVAPELLPADIYQSWERCLALGLDPRKRPEVRVEPAVKLNEAREKLGPARRLALAELHGLSSQIAGSSFMIAFTNADCMLLDVIADPEFVTPARAAGLRPGTIWNEATCGTNALGSAAIQRQAAVVHRAEHFFIDHLGLTCIAHPVFAPDGSLLGVIDASSDCAERQRHTKVLMQLAAAQIENGVFREQHRGDTIIAIHQHSEYLHSLSAGLMALRGDGQVVGANSQARSFLRGRSIAEGPSFEDFFDLKFDALLAQGRQLDCVRMRDRGGLSFVARMEASQGQQAASRTVRATANKIRPSPGKPAFVADDPRLLAIVKEVELAVARQLPILIRGETGTGKELLARHAHIASGRKGAFVPINCAALPDSLIEAELFGYADGAFTGARRGGAKGLVAEADGGTLFLDEIGELPMALQAVLLRLLDDWTVRPVGGQRSIVDVQLVSATNVKLDDAVASGRFRADLLYRMNALEVTLPSLATRSDIDAIAVYVLRMIAPGFRLEQEALAHMRSHPWPGNIRQLRNELARASLKAADGMIDKSMIEAACTNHNDHQHADVRSPHQRGQPTVQSMASPYAVTSPAGDASMRGAHKDMVMAALADAGGNISLAARHLRVSRNTIYRVLGRTAPTGPK